MEEVDRLIAESEVYLENAQREAMDVSGVLDTTSRILAAARGPCILDVSTSDDEEISSSSTATPNSGSPAREAILAAASAVANTATHILNDSEIEILDCTTFPMPLPDRANIDDDDDVFFVSEGPSARRSSHIIDLVSPSPHININANFGNTPTNISVNIGINHHRRAVDRHRPTSFTIASASTSQGSGGHTSSHVITNTPVNVSVGRKRKPVKTMEIAKKPSPEPAEPEPAPGNGFACAVCLEFLKAQLKPVSTNCGHLFCLNCLQQAIRISGKCPLCNKKQGKNSFHRIYI